MSRKKILKIKNWKPHFTSTTIYLFAQESCIPSRNLNIFQPLFLGWTVFFFFQISWWGCTWKGVPCLTFGSCFLVVCPRNMRLWLRRHRRLDLSSWVRNPSFQFFFSPNQSLSLSLEINHRIPLRRCFETFFSVFRDRRWTDAGIPGVPRSDSVAHRRNRPTRCDTDWWTH